MICPSATITDIPFPEKRGAFFTVWIIMSYKGLSLSVTVIEM
jgi:hypothetical protein